jgi:CspA family cold shock protein
LRAALIAIVAAVQCLHDADPRAQAMPVAPVRDQISRQPALLDNKAARFKLEMAMNVGLKFSRSEDCMPTGKIKMFNEDRGFGFIEPDDGGDDIFFHVSALRDGDEISQGKAVSFEMGVDKKSGKTKAVSVDLV